VSVARGVRRDAVSAALVLTSIVLVCQPVLTRLVRQWADDPNTSHGLIVTPIAGYLIWGARRRWIATPAAPSGLGLVIVAGSLAAYAAGVLGAELFVSRISIVGLLAGAAIFIWGWRHLRLIAFPLMLLALTVPPPTIVLNQITFPLQLVASRVGETVISFAGVPVLREGNILVLASTSLEVAEACSGIRSLMSLVTLAVVAAYFRGGTLAGGLALVALAPPIAVVANAARVAGTGIAAHLVGPQAAEGFFHTFSGWLVFLVALALLALCERVITAIERWRAALQRAAARTELEVTCAP
jgi:exosortase